MRFILVILFCYLHISAYSQLMIPVFEEPLIEAKLSDQAEESVPLTFNNGEGMFLNKIYKNEDREIITAQDVWYSESKKGKWASPYRLFRDVDSRAINLLVGCSADGQKIYLLNRRFEDDSIVSRIVYREKSGKNSWGDPVKVDIPGLNVENPQATIFMHPSGNVLLMSEVVEGSGNNEDLYLWHRNAQGLWSGKIHLGDRINSRGLEFSPFLSLDMRALYFASDGHGGQGQSDIFVAYREGDSWEKWSRPLNLGSPINSPDFESDFMISDSTHVYFVSDRIDDHLDIFHTSATGEYKIANLGVLAGQLYRKGKPIAGVKLNAFTSNGDFIERLSTDEEGKFTFRKLFPEDNFSLKQDSVEEVDISGSKLYIVDGNGKLRKRILFNEDGEFVNDKQIAEREWVEGFFMNGGSPMVNTALVINDENGFPIDTIYTNENGKFRYEKLSLDKTIDIKPRDISKEDFEGMEIYAVNKDGNRSKTYLGRSTETGKGVFIYNGLPLSNTTIKILDENGDVVEVLVLNEKGKFSYKRLAMYEDSKFKLQTENGVDIIDGIIYMKDASGKVKRYVIKTGNTAVDLASEGSSEVFGQFEYNKLPAANIGLLVMDENGITIDTIYTDEAGRFNYNKLKMDKNIYFMPLGKESSSDNSSLLLTDLNGNLISKQKLTKKGFSAGQEVEELSTKVSKLKMEQGVFYFDFNQASLSAAELNRLKSLFKSGTLGKNQEIELTGHADNQGTPEVNYAFGLKRANYVKKQLIAIGLPAKSIGISSAGDTKPLKKEDTEEARSKNRRVELKFSN